VPFLQCGGQIRTGQGRRAMLRLEANADPVRFSVFLTERPPQLKIDRLPGNDAAQRAADSGTGAGEYRILLDCRRSLTRKTASARSESRSGRNASNTVRQPRYSS